MQVNPYLNFNGDCAEAFRFYERVLGGKIEMMMTHAESPMAEQTPPEQKDKIMHARLVIGDQVLMASDSPPGYYQKPQGLFVSLMVDTVEDAQRIYAALAENATVTLPLQKTFWAEQFAMLTDRFGTPWMIDCEAKAGS